MTKIKLEDRIVQIRGDVDKPRRFIYYTCTLDNGDKIVLSKLDGTELILANHI